MKKQPVRVIRRGGLPPQVAPPASLYEKGGTRRHDGGIVQRIQRALSIERNWRKKRTGPEGDHYEGYFHTAGMKFRGKATVGRTAMDIHIQHPPPELRHHHHWPCFSRRSGGWFWVHHTRKASLDSAILEIEKILTECRAGPHSPPPPAGGTAPPAGKSSGGLFAAVTKVLKELFP